MGWRYRTVPRPGKAELDASRKIALDAMIEGRFEEGETILKSVDAKLTRPQAKLAARELLKAGKTDAAMRVLAGAMGEEAAKRELAPAPVAKVGDVLHTSWGWEQTNVDFWEVVDVSGSMATVREIQKRIVTRGEYDNMVVGDRGAFVGPPKRVRVQKSYRDGYQIKVEDHTATLWNGKPQRETAAGFGH